MKTIIFDIDGTLVNTENVEDKSFIKAFKTVFNIDIKNQNWNDLKNVTDWGITEEIILNNYSRKPTSQEYQLMIAEFVKLLELEKKKNLLNFSAIPNAKNFFNFIKDNPNYKIGVATGAWKKSAELKLDAIGINMENIAFSNSDLFKSREEITLDVIKKLNAKINDVIYFGDGEWDFKTCKNLGIRFIGIDFNNNKKLKRLGTEHVFKDFKNMKSIVSVL